MKIVIVLFLLEGFMLNNVGGWLLAAEPPLLAPPEPDPVFLESAVDPEPGFLQYAYEPYMLNNESTGHEPEPMFNQQPEKEPLLIAEPEPMFVQQPEWELFAEPEPLFVQQPELAFESQLSNELGLSFAEPEPIPDELDDNLEFATEPHNSLGLEADGSSTSTSTTTSTVPPTKTTSTVPPTTTTTTSVPVVYCDQMQKDSAIKLQLQGRFKVKTDDECRLKCQSTDCMYWNWSKRGCKLYTIGFVQKKRLVSGKCSLSIVKVCEKAGDDTSLKLKKIRIVKVSSPQQCEEECRNDIENCAAWSCIKDKKCILKNVVFPNKRNQVSGYCS